MLPDPPPISVAPPNCVYNKRQLVILVSLLTCWPHYMTLQPSAVNKPQGFTTSPAMSTVQTVRLSRGKPENKPNNCPQSSTGFYTSFIDSIPITRAVYTDAMPLQRPALVFRARLLIYLLRICEGYVWLVTAGLSQCYHNSFATNTLSHASRTRRWACTFIIAW